MEKCPLLHSLLMHSFFPEKFAASGEIHRIEPAQAHSIQRIFTDFIH
jgi:hypothetical protein